MPGETEEIKRRLDIVEFIGEYLPLVRAGGPNMKARCPFHQEKTPSFYISKERQMWHCFGCGEGGDVFSFVMKQEGLEFPEALRMLAERTGVQLAQWNPKERSERMRLFEVVEFATKVFEKYLRDSTKAAHARAYLEKRGVSDAMRDAFRLGYAPDSWDALIQLAGQRGISVPELIKAGMVLQSDRGGYDRFRNRLMFPIRDVHGAVVGFTARTLALVDDPNDPKYINTPQTPLYNKSAVLYGLDRARQETKKQDLAVVVEGNMDVVACHQAGFANTIAVSGTAFTREQLDLIRRFTTRIAVAFDADTAGIRAAEKGIDLAVAEGFQVRVISLPEGAGKDPDEAIKKDPAVWKRAVEQAMPVMDWFFERAFANADLSSPEAKSAIGRMLLPRIGRIPDAIEKTHWLQQLSTRLNVPAEVLRGQLPGAPKPKRIAPTAAPIKAAKPTREILVAEQFLGLLAEEPSRLPEGMAAVAPEMLPDDALADLYRSMIVRYTGGEQPVPDPHSPAVPPSVLATLSRVILRRERASVETPRPDDELRHLSAILRQAHVRSEQKRLAGLLASAEASGDADAVRELTRQFQALISETS